MNERIQELALQAGIEFDDDFPLEPETIYYLKLSDFEKFAELVRADEREACAKLCEEQITGYHFLATHGHFDHMDQAHTNCAEAIRSRGKK